MKKNIIIWLLAAFSISCVLYCYVQHLELKDKQEQLNRMDEQWRKEEVVAKIQQRNCAESLKKMQEEIKRMTDRTPK
ncbi:MAG: hypothetical protein JST43_12090 [Bacteroidetes bacterium]|nr:hypothetical protein [Bacteroidota bacterium]MBS1541384.1 hypothetical protein [Bacteroidota bacterium]